MQRHRPVSHRLLRLIFDLDLDSTKNQFGFVVGGGTSTFVKLYHSSYSLLNI